MSNDFWMNKRVFITGHTGFKGAWLALWLQSLGAKVTGYALKPPSDPNLFEVAQIGAGMHSVMGDIRDLTSLQSEINKAQPEVIFHLAAQSLVRRSYQEPIDTYSTNVMGTVNLLEAVRHAASVKSVVTVTSDKCYENREWDWGYRENDPMGGFDPYSSSKGCAELITAAYRNSYFHVDQYQKHGVGIASARAGNVIGGGDWAEDRLIPDMMRAISIGEPVYIRNPNSIRPWQHVLEPLSGYLALAQKLYLSGARYAESWNFGPHDEDAKPVEWIVKHLRQCWGEELKYIIEDKNDDRDFLHEAHYLKLDCSKARNRLAWQPRWSLAEAIEKICAWHKAYIADENMNVVCLKQIKQFEKASHEL